MTDSCLPSGLEALGRLAAAEGFGMVDRFISDYRDGSNTFFSRAVSTPLPPPDSRPFMYPNLFRRVAATIIDLGVVFGAASFIIQRPLIANPESANLWVAFAFALLYEPVSITYACTVGQAVMRTRVRRFETLARVPLGKSYLRFFMKYVASVFGGASAGGTVRVWPREDLRAIHDQTADTVVVNADATER